MSGTISTEQALIYTMVTMSGVEGHINARTGRDRPARPDPSRFPELRPLRLLTVAQEAGEMLQETDGLKAMLGLVKEPSCPSCAKPPMRWPLKSPPLTLRSARRNCASSPSCATARPRQADDRRPGAFGHRPVPDGLGLRNPPAFTFAGLTRASSLRPRERMPRSSRGKVSFLGVAELPILGKYFLILILRCTMWQARACC